MGLVRYGKILITVQLLLAIELVVSDLYGPGTISFGAFNVQVFGTSKMSKPGVPEALAKIFRRWDIGLIQEIRDASNTAVFQLLSLINQAGPPYYSLILSDRTGRTTSKEQYGFFYRNDSIKVVDSYNFNDTTDIFEREPFPVSFRLPSGNDVFIVPIHTKPEDAVNEIKHLPLVFEDASNRFNTREGIIAGDFNAGCTYVKKSDWPNIPFRSSSDFVWLIDDDIDTTISNTTCAYDRLVVSTLFLSKTLPNSARTYRFELDMGIDVDTAKVISDHYPVEMGLKVVKLLHGENPADNNGYLNSGTIAAIGIGSILLMFFIIGLLFYLSRKYYQKSQSHLVE